MIKQSKKSSTRCRRSACRMRKFKRHDHAHALSQRTRKPHMSSNTRWTSSRLDATSTQLSAHRASQAATPYGLPCRKWWAYLLAMQVMPAWPSNLKCRRWWGCRRLCRVVPSIRSTAQGWSQCRAVAEVIQGRTHTRASECHWVTRTRLRRVLVAEFHAGVTHQCPGRHPCNTAPTEVGPTRPCNEVAYWIPAWVTCDSLTKSSWITRDLNKIGK